MDTHAHTLTLAQAHARARSRSHTHAHMGLRALTCSHAHCYPCAGENGYFRILRGKNVLAIEDGVVGGTLGSKW